VIRNEVRRGCYLDSVVLMRVARALSALPGIAEAGLMIGTAANKEILGEAGVLADAGARAGPADLIIAVAAASEEAAAAAMAEAQRLLDAPMRQAGPASAWHPRTLRGGVRQLADANLAIISVPGAFAAAEARRALRRDLNVLIFSDNVAIADEALLKAEARERGLLVMGPDCGTAIIAGAAIGFANAVPHGDVAIIGASGTGIQELACLLANAGRGISHAIGTGGRDLAAEVGGITTLAALDLLEQHAATRHIVLVSKPAAPEVVAAVHARAARSTKPITSCIVGAPPGEPLAPNIRSCATLQEAAEHVLGHGIAPYRGDVPGPDARRRVIRGLFCGGTLCNEAQAILLRSGHAVASNTPVPGAQRLVENDNISTLIDLGDDAFTRGRPHPMLDPQLRAAPLARALSEAAVGVVLLDVVLGWGSHADPAGEVIRALPKAPPLEGGRPVVIASVTGTEADPQVRSRQVAKLTDGGIIVAPSNAAAAVLALQCAG
jgi:succinyl-CoA synthetase alpha subunit